MQPHSVRFGICLLMTIVTGITLYGDEIQPMRHGDTLQPFELNDFQGRLWPSREFKRSKLLALVFLGTECPLVKLYASELNGIANSYSKDQLQIVGINSNTHDSMTEIAHFARTTNIEFPILKDVGNQLADHLGATRTPEVFLFDANRNLQYHGKINDRHSYGQTRDSAKHHYLTDAIAALLDGAPVVNQTTAAEGCIIGRTKRRSGQGNVTFANQISRLLQKHCVQCHRPGEIAPFSLTDYEEVAGWAEMIGEVVREQRMPPWHANPEHGEFKNDARLTEADKKLIYQWIDDGAPLGEVTQLPPSQKWETGWQIGTPDVIIPMSKRPAKIAANGVIPYKYFVVDPGFTEDKWVRSAECRAGNRSVVHHIIVGIKGKDDALHGDIESEWLTANAPGSPPLQLPPGHAKFVPAGSKLVFQMHYTPNGKPTTDISQVGLVFADPKSVEHVVGTHKAYNRRFRIPPGADNHQVLANYRVEQDMVILSLFPHMHLRGKSFRYNAHWPDGTMETLLDIPNYDFNWQNGYHFSEPLKVPAGTRIECIAHFDNSKNNFANPDPQKTIRWGDQTFDEMMIGYFDCFYAKFDSPDPNRQPHSKQPKKSSPKSSEVLTEAMIKVAKQALQSQSKMNQFGLQLHPHFPQIDRMCWTAIDDGKLKVERAVQIKAVKTKLGADGLSREAKQCKLAEIALQTDPVRLNRDDYKSNVDVRFFGTVMKSSFHVPVTIDGKRGTINFWSREADAFPKESQEILLQIGQALSRR